MKINRIVNEGFMKTMLAAYLPGNSTVDLREVAVPTPGINQVLIKMKSSGICGSDVHYIYHQHRATAAAPDKPLYQGFINGHEPCGQIVAMEQGCRHFKEGDRVLVYHISGCGFCPNCRRGFPISCTGKGKAAYGWQRDGGHAEYLLAEEKDLILLPDALSYEDGAFISCGVGTAYEGILRGEVSGSDNVLVVGLGPVGMMAMMLAKGCGAKRIIGVDMLPERLAMAKQLGVMDHGYLATTEGLPQIIAELTHGGADVALDCSGNAAGRLLALQSTADWGRVVYIGETGKVEFEVSADLMHHQRRIIGSWVTSLFHMEKCAHDLTDWKLWPRNAITHRFSLEQAGDAYALMASGKCGKVVINFTD
ncbi:alcohol dehydrogenase catalytic domain-containing protein [Escherichia coli]|nr:alcohol dehydrogenase catalytic domain-containing protein [Escherichia coli]